MASFVIPFDVANIERARVDIIVVGTPSMVQLAGKAADILATGITDTRTTVPLDMDTINVPVRKTSRCIVIDEGHQRRCVTTKTGSRIR